MQDAILSKIRPKILVIINAQDRELRNVLTRWLYRSLQHVGGGQSKAAYCAIQKSPYWLGEEGVDKLTELKLRPSMGSITWKNLDQGWKITRTVNFINEVWKDEIQKFIGITIWN